MKQRRKIRLSYLNTGESAIAEMLDDEAPLVCEYIWSILPIEHRMLHGMYSGAEVFALLNQAKQLPPENICYLPLPGELLYFFDGSTSVANSKKPISELVIVYGRGVSLKGPEGVPTYCSLFARIPGDWKYDWVEFAAACKQARLQGPPVLRIERFAEREVV
jgi:hypothetical protein